MSTAVIGVKNNFVGQSYTVDLLVVQVLYTAVAITQDLREGSRHMGE